MKKYIVEAVALSHRLFLLVSMLSSPSSQTTPLGHVYLKPEITNVDEVREGKVCMTEEMVEGVG